MNICENKLGLWVADGDCEDCWTIECVYFLIQFLLCSGSRSPVVKEYSFLYYNYTTGDDDDDGDGLCDIIFLAGYQNSRAAR